MNAPIQELRIFVMPGYLRFKGTRAQIEAEGLIPAGTEYPRDDDVVSWERGEVEFRLRHGRPDDAKGHRRAWAGADCWCVDVNVPAHDWRWWQRRRVQEKVDALHAEIYRQTADGAKAERLLFRRWCAARSDNAYQAFRSQCLPACKKPGRPCGATVAGANAGS